MQIKGFRASYGDSNGAHDLLKASAEIETIAERLTTFTDKAPHSPPDLVWDPFFRGFAFENYYVLIKIFPDPTASRTGMVFSEALFYPLIEATEISNFGSLLSAFSTAVAEGKQIQSNEFRISISENELHNTNPEPPGLVALLNNLIENEREDTLVWIGQNGFAEVTTALWNRITPALRKKMSFRFCFVPQNFSGRRPSIIYTPSQLSGRWIEYQRISPANAEAPKNKVVAFLLGRNEGKPIRDLFFDLEIEPTDWKSLHLCEQCVNYQVKLNRGEITISEFRGLISRIAVLSSDEEQGSDFKENLFGQFCEKVVGGSFEDIFALNNLNLKPFPKANYFLNKSIKGWLKRNLLAISPVEAAKIFPRAKELYEQTWGSSALDSLIIVTENWSKETAKILWRWWHESAELFEISRNYFPQTKKVTSILCETCPRTLPARLGKIVSEFAAGNKDWRLYAAAVTAYLSPVEAVIQQLKMEPPKSRPENSGLPVLFDRLETGDILDAFLQIDNTRLLPPLAKRIVTNPKLLAKINFNNAGWQKLAQLMLEKTTEKFWQNASNPQETVFQILDAKLSGILCEPQLITFAGRSRFADLSSYSQRESLWTYLENEDLENFSSATADAWWLTFVNNSQLEKIEKPEHLLKQYILNDDRVKEAIENASSSIDLLIRVFKFFKELNQDNFENLLYFALDKTRHVNQVTAIGLGKFIAERNWKNCAGTLKNQIDRHGRSDLLSALQQCADMFGWIESLLSSTLSNLKQIPLRWEDWWNAFTDCLTDLYQNGPTQNHLWKRAGGDESTILKHVTGRDSWLHAIQTLRDGGGGKKISTFSIIKQVKDDYHNNEKIELLERLFYQLGGKY